VEPRRLFLIPTFAVCSCFNRFTAMCRRIGPTPYGRFLPSRTDTHTRINVSRRKPSGSFIVMEDDVLPWTEQVGLLRRELVVNRCDLAVDKDARVRCEVNISARLALQVLL